MSKLVFRKLAVVIAAGHDDMLDTAALVPSSNLRKKSTTRGKPEGSLYASDVRISLVSCFCFCSAPQYDADELVGANVAGRWTSGKKDAAARPLHEGAAPHAVPPAPQGKAPTLSKLTVSNRARFKVLRAHRSLNWAAKRRCDSFRKKSSPSPPPAQGTQGGQQTGLIFAALVWFPSTGRTSRCDRVVVQSSLPCHLPPSFPTNSLGAE